MGPVHVAVMTLCYLQTVNKAFNASRIEFRHSFNESESYVIEAKHKLR